MNPDPDFVLRGKTSSYWSRPGYLNNSELTTTTKRLAEYSPECYDDSDSKRMTQSLRSMSHHLNQVSSNLKQSLLGKDSDVSNLSLSRDHSSLRTSATENELAKLMQQNLELEDSYDGKPRSSEVTEWYTHPVHLSQTYVPKSSTYIRPRSVSPVRKNTGILGPALDDEFSSQDRVNREMEYKRFASKDAIAARYFPVTLGAAYYMQAADSRTGLPLGSMKQRPSRSQSRSGTSILKKYKRAKSAARIDEILQDVDSHKRDKLRYLVTEAPTIASSLNVITVTPYQAELAKLRMERLRIEEDRLLELKRQEELERIRGPKPKWYEMKSPEFHYEAHKNNQLIRSRDKWDDLLAYREDLMTASDDFHRSWNTPLVA